MIKSLLSDRCYYAEARALSQSLYMPCPTHLISCASCEHEVPFSTLLGYHSTATRRDRELPSADLPFKVKPLDTFLHAPQSADQDIARLTQNCRKSVETSDAKFKLAPIDYDNDDEEVDAIGPEQLCVVARMLTRDHITDQQPKMLEHRVRPNSKDFIGVIEPHWQGICSELSSRRDTTEVDEAMKTITDATRQRLFHANWEALDKNRTLRMHRSSGPVLEARLQAGLQTVGSSDRLLESIAASTGNELENALQPENLCIPESELLWRQQWVDLVRTCQLQHGPHFPSSITPSQALAPLCSARERSERSRELLEQTLFTIRNPNEKSPAYRLGRGLVDVATSAEAPNTSSLPMDECIHFGAIDTKRHASLSLWLQLLCPVKISVSAMVNATGFCAVTLAAHEHTFVVRLMNVQDQVQPLPAPKPIDCVEQATWGQTAVTGIQDDKVAMTLMGMRQSRRRMDVKCRRPKIVELLGLSMAQLHIRNMVPPSPSVIMFQPNRFRILAAPTRFVGGYEETSSMKQDRAASVALAHKFECDVALQNRHETGDLG